MSGNIVFKNGDSVIFSNVPGSETSLSQKSSLKKKAASAKISKRRIIEIFDKIAESETDPGWKERFEKMKISKFPPKISWVNGLEGSDVAGIMTYKFRSIHREQEILRSTSPEANAVIIKEFIKRFTNIGISNQDFDLVNVPKDNIEPIVWAKLPSREQSKKISKYVDYYAMRKDLDSEQKSQLFSMLILKSSMGVLFSSMEFDKEGDIINIKGIFYDKENDYYDFSK